MNSERGNSSVEAQPFAFRILTQQFGITGNLVGAPVSELRRLRRKGDLAWTKNKIMSLPVTRLATPEEIASAYVYLALESALFMVGHSLSPNGGALMW